MKQIYPVECPGCDKTISIRLDDGEVKETPCQCKKLKLKVVWKPVLEEVK